MIWRMNELVLKGVSMLSSIFFCIPLYFWAKKVFFKGKVYHQRLNKDETAIVMWTFTIDSQKRHFDKLCRNLKKRVAI